MSVEDEIDDKPPSNWADMLPILVAATVAAGALMLCFFSFTVPGDNAPAPPPDMGTMTNDKSGEVMIGVGQGASIHPKPATAPTRP
ncbi:MAG: hypothetical protein JO348_04685 [Alphaproteobacteria bacterium]|nr:hypothetical protein [Alphaproteobacteria bacterium]MBV9419049.1 hypothetical protein [Alphaproteobacteria bacterium]MBV9540088.1 hypothetical protein [Alphaproteobacteria bacterium]MBV9904401.1 hypothetical protein [Alphaproteobacteria bacterium]